MPSAVFRSRFLFTLFILWIGHFLVDFMIGIWPVYKTMMHVDLAFAGILAGFSALLGEGSQLLFGWLSDRGYRFHLLVFGLIFTCASTLLVYFDHYAIYFILLLFTALGSAAFHPSAVGLLASLTEDRKAQFITFFQSGGSLGVGLSQVVFAGCYNLLDGHMIALAVPSIILVGIAFMRPLSSAPITSPAAVAKKASFGEIFKLFKNKQFTFLYVSLVCTMSVTWGLIFLLPDLLKSRSVEPWLCYGGGQLCMSLGSIVMLFSGGYLGDKYSPKRVILLAIALSTVAFYSLLLIPEPSTIMIMSLLLGLGALMSLIHPTSLAFGNRLIPEHPGMVSACLMGLVWCLSELIGPMGSGFLATLFTEDAPAKALGVLGVFFFIGGSLMMGLPHLASKPIKEESPIATA